MIKPISLVFCAALLGTLTPCMPAFAQETSSPRSTVAATHTLAQLLGTARTTQAQLSSAEQAAVTQLVRQNMRTLDPDNRLGPQGIKTLTARLDADIRPLVRQTFASVRSAKTAGAFEQALADTLSPAQTNALLAYLHTPLGKRYLSFNHQLDELVGRGIALMASTPVSFGRDQMPPAATMQLRHRLLAMSTSANALAAEHPKGKPPAFGIISDLLSMQIGTQLDHLGQRYQPDLQAFAAFQAGDAAKALARAQALWSNRESTRLEPLIRQIDQSLSTHRADWQALAGQWQSGERAGK